MGSFFSTSNDKPKTGGYNSFTPHVTLIGEKHTSYGKFIHVKENSTHKDMYRQERHFHEANKFRQTLRKYDAEFSKTHPNLVNIIGYTSKLKGSVCGFSADVYLYIDYFSETLQDEVEKRKPSNDAFSEAQLQSIVEQLVALFAESQNQDYTFSDIRPSNVFVAGTTYKVWKDLDESGKNMTGLMKAAILGEKPLLAPELAAQIPVKDIKIKTNKFKADVFSLGATLLALATLTNSEDLYDYAQGTIDMNLLEKRLNQVEANYSPKFAELVRQLLTHSEANRPDFVALQRQLN